MLAYYGFLALFPLLLLLVTLLGVVLNRDVKFQHRVLNSALREFPIIGDQLGRNIHSLRAHGLGIALGVVGLVWGALGIAQIGQHAMAGTVRGFIDHTQCPKTLTRLMIGGVEHGEMSQWALYCGGFGVIGAGALLSTAVTGLGAAGHRAAGVRVLQLALSCGMNVGLFIVGFRVLTPRQIPAHDLVLGASLAGLAWTALQTLGGYLVSHQLRHASQVYGLFGIVLGLLSFLALTATLSLYAAELNVVRVRHLWPRSIVQPPLTSSDKQVLSDIAEQEERRPEQTVEVTYTDQSPTSEP